jgi:hypothetical protein
VNNRLDSSGSEPVSSLLPAVTAPGGSRPGPDIFPAEFDTGEEIRGESASGASRPADGSEVLGPTGGARIYAADSPIRGEQGPTAEGKVDVPVPPIREERPRNAGGCWPVEERAVKGAGQVTASTQRVGRSSPLVGEGVSGDPPRSASEARTATLPRRTKNELIRPIEGEGCWRCALPASVVVIGSHGAPWPYCEGHGIDRMAAEFTLLLFEARKGERG